MYIYIYIYTDIYIYIYIYIYTYVDQRSLQFGSQEWFMRATEPKRAVPVENTTYDNIMFLILIVFLFFLFFYVLVYTTYDNIYILAIFYPPLK